MANTGVFPVDPSTLAGKVRILVGDTDASNINGGEGEYAWFSDSELEALGEMFGGNPKRVAIWVLSQVAISEALLLKKFTTDDLAVDGPAITAAIEKTIARLSEEVEKESQNEDAWFELYDLADSGYRRGEAAAYPWPWMRWF